MFSSLWVLATTAYVLYLHYRINNLSEDHKLEIWSLKESRDAHHERLCNQSNTLYDHRLRLEETEKRLEAVGSILSEGK